MNASQSPVAEGKRKPGCLLKTLLAVAVAFLFAFGCPIYEITGILCPCCGVTRAWLAFLTGQFYLAFQYHGLFPLIPLIGVLYVLRDLLPSLRRRRVVILMYSLAAAVFLYGCLRWCGVVVMP